MSRLPKSLVLALPAVLVAAPLLAQGSPAAQGGMEFRTVSYDSGSVKSVSEIAFPIGLAYPVSPRLTLDVSTFGVSAQLTRRDSTSSTSTISGLTDVLVRGIYQLKPDVAVLTVSVNLPTGKKTVSGSQFDVVSSVGSDLVPFPVVSFGTGFNVTTGVALATPAGPWALGFSGSFRYNGSYLPFSDTAGGVDTFSVKPGAETRLRIGADRIVGQGRLSLGVTYSTFANDEIGGTPRKSGARYIPQVSLSLPMGTGGNLSLYGYDIYRSLNDTSISATNLNTMTLGALFSIRAGSRNAFRPQFEYRQSSGYVSGHLLSLIARYQAALGDRVMLMPGARFDTGSLTSVTGAQVGAKITGLSASLTLRTSF